MHRTRIVVATSVALAAVAVAFAADASAHITISAPGATRGGADQEITFRVPVEKTVDTVGLIVALPTDTPIASVLVEPIPGWTHTERTTTLAKPVVTDDGTITAAVSRIIWTARPGHGIKQGEFGAFTIIAGQLPDAPSLTFSALQRYADGSVVRWNQVAAPGATDEPTNPAPVLDLATGADSGRPDQPAATGARTAVALTLSIIALVVAIGAAGFVAYSRLRRNTPR